MILYAAGVSKCQTPLPKTNFDNTKIIVTNQA